MEPPDIRLDGLLDYILSPADSELAYSRCRWAVGRGYHASRDNLAAHFCEAAYRLATHVDLAVEPPAAFDLLVPQLLTALQDVLVFRATRRVARKTNFRARNAPSFNVVATTKEFSLTYVSENSTRWNLSHLLWNAMSSSELIALCRRFGAAVIPAVAVAAVYTAATA